MKTLLVWALVALAPFAGVRMICLDPDSLDARLERAAASAQAVEGEHCQQTCPRHARPAGTPAPAPRPTCFFVADATCEVALGLAIAVMPTPAEFTLARVATRVEPIVSFTTYLAPVLTPPGPPPKA